MQLKVKLDKDSVPVLLPDLGITVHGHREGNGSGEWETDALSMVHPSCELVSQANAELILFVLWAKHAPEDSGTKVMPKLLFLSSSSYSNRNLMDGGKMKHNTK